MSNVRSSRVALVTGANSGIGLELTLRLLAEGWRVVTLTRSELPAEPSLRSAVGRGALTAYRADLTDFVSLRSALAEIKAEEKRLDALFNNAGVMLDRSVLSPQGRDVHFEVHTAAPYILLTELQPLLAAGDLKTVVNTSSNTLLMVKRFNPETLERPAEFKKIFGPYAATKLALSLWTEAAAVSERFRDLKLLSVCPGSNKTAINTGSGMPRYLVPLRNLFFSHPRKGASKLYEAMAGAGRYANGAFLHRGKETALPFREQGPILLDRVDRIYREAGF